MSANVENGDNTNGVDPHAVGAITDSVLSSSQTKIDQEPQKPMEIAAKTLTPPTTGKGNSKPTKETKPKPTSTNSNTDSMQTNANKSTEPLKAKIKRWSTFNWGKGKQQGRESDPNERDEEKIQGQDIPSIPPIEQQPAMDLLQNNGDLLAAQSSVPIEKRAEPLFITTQVGDNTKQQDRNQDHGFIHIGHAEAQIPGNDIAVVSGSEKRIEEPKKVSPEMDIASLRKLVNELRKQVEGHNTAVTEITSLKKQVAEHDTAIALLKAQKDPGSPTPNHKVKETKPVLGEGELTTSPIQERPGGSLVFRKADGISLTEVANLVKELNAQIDQIASLVIDLLEPSSSGKDLEIAWDGDLQDYLGSWLCNELQRTSEEPEIDTMVAHIVLQTGLVHACNRIINDWNPPYWTEGSTFSRIFSNMTGTEDSITVDTWKALTRNYMGSHEDQLEANKKYLEKVLLKLIIAVSGSQKSGETLLSQCNEKVDDIAKKAIGIHQVISRETSSTDLSTFTVESDTDFDQSQMEDTDGKAGPTLPSKVVCTVEMGLRGKKRASSRQQSGDGKVGVGVTLKAKVVLPATLSGLPEQ